MSILSEELGTAEAANRHRRHWSAFDDVQSRYNTDSTFRHMVDMMHAIIIRAGTLTPGEVRQAAGLAAVHYDMYRQMNEPQLVGILDPDRAGNKTGA
jgi:hypothetical protein